MSRAGLRLQGFRSRRLHYDLISPLIYMTNAQRTLCSWRTTLQSKIFFKEGQSHCWAEEMKERTLPTLQASHALPGLNRHCPLVLVVRQVLLRRSARSTLLLLVLLLLLWDACQHGGVAEVGLGIGAPDLNRFRIVRPADNNVLPSSLCWSHILVSHGEHGPISCGGRPR